MRSKRVDTTSRRDESIKNYDAKGNKNGKKWSVVVETIKKPRGGMRMGIYNQTGVRSVTYK